MMFNKLITFLVSLSNFQKNLFIIFVDILILILSLWVTLSFNSKSFYLPTRIDLLPIFLFLIIALPVFAYFDLYRSVIRYAGFKEIWSITKAVSSYIFISFLLNLSIDKEFLSLPLLFNQWLLLLLLVCSSRLFASWILLEKSISSNVVIYGAGAAGIQLASALRFSRELKPVAYIDEEKLKQGKFLGGIRIFSPSKLPVLIKERDVREVLIAIPSAKKFELNRIVSSIGDLTIKVRVLPGVEELAQGKISVSDLKVLDITDLLGRNATVPLQDLLAKNIRNKNVMVTGAGGSIGSELCRQIVKIDPESLVLFEISEASLYTIEQELDSYNLDSKIYPILGNITDKQRMVEVCKAFSVETIYHAAAYKQVPMVELNTIQSVENNIFGTLNCALSAIESEVETFVLISTDKAVRPTNIMGATKRFSELILQGLAKKREESEGNKNINFTIVRFGNVLDSSSSVVPLFREQIKKGGPVTVTDPEVIRYFMSIPEAAELVIQAGSLGKGSEVFVLDMGEPIKIIDLAKKMINLSGLEVFDKETKEGDIEVVFTGLRDGEKLYEELLLGENVSKTEHERILKAEEESLSWEEILSLLDEFRKAIQARDESEVNELLVRSISGFKPYSGLNDLIFVSKNGSNTSN